MTNSWLSNTCGRHSPVCVKSKERPMNIRLTLWHSLQKCWYLRVCFHMLQHVCKAGASPCIDVRGCGIHLMCPTCCIRPGSEANGVWFCIPLHLLLTWCVCSKLCVNISDWDSCVRIDRIGFVFLKKYSKVFYWVFFYLKSTPFTFLKV